MKSPSHRKLVAGFALSVALIVSVTWMNMGRENRSQDASNWVAHTHLVRYSISRMFSDLQEVTSATRGYILTGTPVFLEPYYAAVKQVGNQILLVRSLTSTIPEQQKNLDALEPLINRRLELAAQVVRVRQEQGFEAAQALVAGGEGRKTMEAVRAVIEKMDAVEVLLLKARGEVNRRGEASVHAWTVAGAAGSLVLLALVFALLLHENRQRQALAEIVESSEDAIIGKDLNGIITSWNKGAEKIFGYAAAEIVGTSIQRLIPSDRQQEEHAILEKIRGGDKVDHFETLRQTKAGRLLNVSITASPIKDAKGTVIGASKVARDITGKKQAENSIAKLSAELETIFNSVPTMIWYKDDKNNFLRVNRSAAQTMGRTVAETEGRSAYDLMPNEAEHYYEDDREVITSGKPKLNIIERLPTTSGETRWVQTDKVPCRDETGNIIGVIVICADITERKRVEEKLAVALEFHKQLLGNAPALIWRAGTDAKCSWFNTTWLEFTGRTMEQELGDGWVEGVHPDDLDRCLKIYQDAFAARQPFQMDYRLRRPDGSYSWISDSGIALNDVSGGFCGYIGYCFDITERMQFQKELSRKNADLELFTTAVSHDLKSPLVTVKTFLGYLEKDLDDPGARAKDLGYIRSAADKMKRLLDDLLALARIGHLRNEPVVLPLQEVVREALGIVAGQIAERGVRVEVTPEPVLLHGNRPQLVAVFQNLLDNAVKFLGDQPAPRIEVGAETEDGEIVLFVRDNGKGIDPCDQPKIFGMFQKLDAHTPGSGIGLAMVRRIVEAHGGKIHAQSDGPGMGATFRFTLEKTQIKFP